MPEMLGARRRDAWVARTLAPALVALVFWVHASVPSGIAMPALYVVPILLFIRTGRFWEPLLVAAAASAATIVDAYLPHPGGNIAIDRLNLPLELGVIWLSAGCVAYHRVAHDRWSEHVVRNITQRKAAEARLAEQAALTQLGELAAVVAHEVRNPLAGLRGTLEVLQPRAGLSSRDRDVIQVMIERIDTLNAKMNDILRFARPQMPVLRHLPIIPIIEEAVETACAAVGPDRPCVDITGDEAHIHGDPDMVRAALLNLVLNACQAGSTRVEIRISSDDRVCRIEVLDNGCGIPQDVIAHMFEAFYTTKKAGTGLGLPIVKRLVELQDGTVSLKPRAGGGTVAEVTLLLATPAAATAKRAAALYRAAGSAASAISHATRAPLP